MASKVQMDRLIREWSKSGTPAKGEQPQPSADLFLEKSILDKLKSLKSLGFQCGKVRLSSYSGLSFQCEFTLEEGSRLAKEMKKQKDDYRLWTDNFSARVRAHQAEGLVLRKRLALEKTTPELLEAITKYLTQK